MQCYYYGRPAYSRCGHYIFVMVSCRMQKITKIRHLRTIAQLCRAISSQIRHVSTIRKKLVKQHISSTCLHNMVNVGPLAAKIGWRVWGTPANFNGFRILASLLHRRHSTEVKQTLHAVWPSPVLVYYIDILGTLAPNRVLSGAKFTLRPSRVFRYWQRYCMGLEQWASAKLCGIQQRAPPIFGKAVITLDIGSHFSFFTVLFWSFIGLLL